MAIPTLYKEEENKKKSLRLSISLHILILLLALWPLLKDDPEQNIDKQYAIQVKFELGSSSNSFKGQAAEGAQRKRNENVELVKTAPVAEVPKNTENKPIPQPKVHVQEQKPQVPITQTESEIFEKEADIEAVEEVKEVVNEVPKRQVESSSEPETVTALETTDTPQEIEDVPSQVPASVQKPSSGGGTNSSSPSNQDGNGTGQGKKGKGAGSDKSGNDSTSGIGTGGAGKGAFDGSGKGIFGRQPVEKGWKSGTISKRKGRILFKVCIDSRGRSTYVNVIKSRSVVKNGKKIKQRTTIRDKKILRAAIDYIGGFIWEEYNDGKVEQCGTYALITE